MWVRRGRIKGRPFYIPGAPPYTYVPSSWQIFRLVLARTVHGEGCQKSTGGFFRLGRFRRLLRKRAHSCRCNSDRLCVTLEQLSWLATLSVFAVSNLQPLCTFGKIRYSLQLRN
jgi:hypothetical protein